MRRRSCTRPERPRSTALLRPALMFALAATPLAISTAAPSDRPDPSSLAVLSPSRAYTETDGASLYANVCQGCHMRDGRGATGAAAYPSLVANPDLRSTAYVVETVLGGLRGMPPVGRSMSDDQVAAVVNFVRISFGNVADDMVTNTDVKAMRGRLH